MLLGIPTSLGARRWGSGSNTFFAPAPYRTFNVQVLSADVEQLL
jgi:hypothetical protein